MIHQYERKEIQIEGKKERKRTGRKMRSEKRNDGKMFGKQTERKNKTNE